MIKRGLFFSLVVCDMYIMVEKIVFTIILCYELLHKLFKISKHEKRK